jgi:putative DNA primase/helicase
VSDTPDPARDRERFAERLRDAGLDDQRFINVLDGEKGTRTSAHQKPQNWLAPADERLSGNYGVHPGAGTNSELWLVEFDKDDYHGTEDTSALDELTETLGINSPHTKPGESGHDYYAAEAEAVEVLKELTGTYNPEPAWGEIKAKGKYVVGPGSQLDGCTKEWCDECDKSDGGYYRIANDVPIATLTRDDLEAVIRADSELGSAQLPNGGESRAVEADSGNETPTPEADKSPSGGGSDAPEVMPPCYREALKTRVDPREATVNEHEVSKHAAMLGLWAGYSAEDVATHMTEEFAPGQHAGIATDPDETRYQVKMLGGKTDRDSPLRPPSPVKLKQAGIMPEFAPDTCGERCVIHSTASTDGGTAAASAPSGGPAGGETDTAADGGGDENTNSHAVALTPQSVKARAGLDDEDDDLTDLTDREKAYWVWQIIDDRDDHHLLAAVPDGKDNPESVVYRYESGLWVPSGEQLLRQIGADALGAQYSENVRREMVEQVRARAAKPRDVLEANAGMLAAENGLLDIEDRDVRPLQPEDYALRRLGAEFDPEADCPRWHEFLDDVVKEGDIEPLQEYVGYCLMHWQMPYKRAALLLGPQDSGKSTFLNVVRTLLGGHRNVSSENLNSLVNTRWGKANLHGKIANITNELETTPLETLGTFKAITGGGDLLTAERKGKDPFQFVPLAKHMFAANRVPPAKDADDAFHERWLHIRFPEAVPKSEQVPGLDDRLIDEELAGILNWALDGYDRLTDQQRFTGDQAVGRKRELWEAYGHSVKRFKHNCLDVTGDSDDVIVKKVGHACYATFCEDWAGTEVESQSKFTRELTNDGKVGQSRRTVRDGDKQRTVYTGVKFDPHALEKLEFDPGAALDAIRDDVDDDDPDDGQGRLGGFDG